LYVISNLKKEAIMNKKSATVKKTTKKAAKKTYPKKKSPPKPRQITLADLAAVVAETEARIAKSREETDAAIASLVTENKQTSALVREISKNIGSVGKDLGELMEFIVIPKIRLAINATGKHTFDTMKTDRTFRKIDEIGEKKALTEVDVLLYSDTEVMAIETKSNLIIRDVKKHLERLDILRQHEDLVGIKDKKLVGAVVGAIVDKEVKDFALERGLYVVKIREEEGKLDVLEPESYRKW
jgi:hypothetical protein